MNKYFCIILIILFSQCTTIQQKKNLKFDFVNNELYLITFKEKKDSIVWKFNEGRKFEEIIFYNFKELRTSPYRVYSLEEYGVGVACMLPQNMNCKLSQFYDKGNLKVIGNYKLGKLDGKWIHLSVNKDTLFSGNFEKGNLISCNKCDSTFLNQIFR